ncbi:hypothetical protein ECP030481613_4972 [Escherichia coli P0304816.13]|nr:hypothetical protein ECMP02155212_3596 [Escherichia coli MP021552.12]EMU69232.1 hypothetical protein ECMP0215527_5680 [Escherichia coli MP021552.7]EMX37070.1 hypothetical protein ECMP0215528_3088 [Escherichia coli MP021552.8]ENF23332.1 hypothetical protein ECP030481611_0358 [Escherichia coli P0304816.11]ENF26752.1 hypothetical protein ECP030481610_0393 [Escherichia coli P0304816.10]ENF29013.1 hypothetical protein ECP030481612_3408 [Escherichia coli P0304816.12]ENF34478.1 hypothetical prote
MELYFFYYNGNTKNEVPIRKLIINFFIFVFLEETFHIKLPENDS